MLFLLLFPLLTPYRSSLSPLLSPLSPVFLEHVGVRHHRGARQDRLRRPQVLAEAPWPLHRVHELAPGLRSPLDLEPQHGPVDAVAVLRVGEGLLGEAGQSRVAHYVHLCAVSDFFSFFVLLVAPAAFAVSGIVGPIHDAKDAIA